MNTAGPNMHRMPSLDSTYTSGTDDSPFASGLTTPTDELTIDVDIERYEGSDAQYTDCPVTPRPNREAAYDNSASPGSKLSLRKAVAKARSMARLVVTSPKKLRKRRATDTGEDFVGDAGPSNINISVEVEVDTRIDAGEPARTALMRESATEKLRTPARGFPQKHTLSPMPEVEITVMCVLDAICTASEPVTVNACVRFVCLATLLPLYSVLVGGCILLAPSYIDTVAFGHGYYFGYPPRGVARFSHWAYCAWPHIFTFLACVAYLMRWKFYLGIPIAAFVVAGFVFSWSDFRVDKSIPLGTDDRQSVFLAVTEGVVGNGYRVEVNGVVHTIQDDVDMSAKDYM